MADAAIHAPGAGAHAARPNLEGGTLPVAMMLSGGLFVLFANLF